MPAPEHLHAVVRGWVQKAENDLVNAAHTLKLGPTAPTDTICFHAQQCVEKYLKAMLVLSGRDFPRTHDIEDLVRRLPRGIDPGLSANEQERLTMYATITRYPGGDDPVPIAAARKGVAIARRVRKAVRKHLPRPILRAPRG